MVTELEGKSPQVEGVESTPVKEEAKPTKPEGESTVAKTYTEENFRKELDKALGKGLESTNKQLSLRRKEAEAAKAEAEEHKAAVASLTAELEDIRREQEELIGKQFSEDPEARKAYVDRHSIAEEKRKLAKEKAEVERKLFKAEKLAYTVTLAQKADSLHKETGVPLKDLEECTTEDEMEVKALRYQVKQATEKKPEPQKEEEKFDSGASSGSGGMPEHPTAEQLERWTPEQYAKWAAKRYAGK